MKEYFIYFRIRAFIFLIFLSFIKMSYQDVNTNFQYPTSLTLLDNSIAIVNSEGIHFYNERFNEEYTNKAIYFTLDENEYKNVFMAQFSNENNGYILIFAKKKLRIFDNQKNLLKEEEITDSEIINTNILNLIPYKKDDNILFFYI